MYIIFVISIRIKIIKMSEKYNKYLAQLNYRANNNSFRKITGKIVEFYKSDKNRNKNSFIQWVIGGRGWGKTCLLFIIINLILYKNPKRFVQFYKAPEFLIENIKNSEAPEDIKNRIFAIDKIRFIEPNALFVIDEGLLGANGKEALKIAMRNLGKFLSKSRHPNVIIIINSVNLNILSEFRDMIDIIVYKHLSTTFIKNNRHRDPFLEDNMDKITNLKEQEGILISDYKYFEAKGTFLLDLKDYCSWYNDSISRYQEKTNPDVSFDEILKNSEEIEQIALSIVMEKGLEFLTKKGYDDFISWMYLDNTDIYHDHKADLKLIYRVYTYIIRHPEKYNLIFEEEEDDDSILLDFMKDFKKDFKFTYNKEDLYSIIIKETKWRKPKRDFDIYERRIKGDFLQDIAKSYKELSNEQAVCRIAVKVEGAVNYYKGKMFERVCKRFIRENLSKYGKPFADTGKSGETDILLSNETTNTLYVISIKTNETEDVSKIYYPEDLRPEIRDAFEFSTFSKDWKKVYLILIVYNTKLDKLILKEVDYRHPKNILIQYV